MKKTIQNLIIHLMVFSICFLTGCVDGLVRDDELIKFIRGINVETIHDNQYFYSIKTITNNISFDEAIVFDSYSKITLINEQECKIKGVVFVVRSLQNTTLNFKVFLQDEFILEKTYELFANINEIVDLFFNDSVLINDSNLSIIVNQIFEYGQEVENASFAADSFLIFFKE